MRYQNEAEAYANDVIPRARSEADKGQISYETAMIKNKYQWNNEKLKHLIVLPYATDKGHNLVYMECK